MSRNQKILLFSIVSIAILTSILSTNSRVEAQQNFVSLEQNKEYTVAHFNHDHHHDRHHDGHQDRHNDRHPWRIDNHRQQMAREWERIRWQRYQRCIHNSQFVSRWHCAQILREPNPFRILRYGVGF